MRFSLLDILSPHYCCSCGKIGKPLCGYCKYNIINEASAQCLACLRPVARYGDTCSVCAVHYQKGWFVGLHRDAVRALVARYKFERLRAAGTVLADLLHESLPQLPADITVVAVPTVRAHVRQRGYDHAALVARRLAMQRGLPYAPAVLRVGRTTQRGASRAQRIQQAECAFACPVASGRYLLIDDVCTTGATVNYAAKALKDGGAREVWVAVISREPLD